MKWSAQFFKWGFFLLLVLNVVLISLPLFHKDHHGPPDFKEIIVRLNEDLDLDAKQKVQLVKLFQRHEREQDSLHAGMDQVRIQMYECLKNDQPCESVFENLSLKKADFERLHFEHHQRILKILNQKQKVKYMDHLRHGPFGGPPPGPPPF